MHYEQILSIFCTIVAVHTSTSSRPGRNRSICQHKCDSSDHGIFGQFATHSTLRDVLFNFSHEIRDSSSCHFVHLTLGAGDSFIASSHRVFGGCRFTADHSGKEKKNTGRVWDWLPPLLSFGVDFI